MNIKTRFQKTALTLTAIIATSMMPSQSQAIGTGSWLRIGACQEGHSWMSEEPFYHRVQYGENLLRIIKLYNEGKVFGLDEHGQQVYYPTWTATANGIKTTDYIHPGDRLLIPWKKVEYGCP